MAPCLSKLPSVCLEAIFKHVPLLDLFRSIGLVCSSWYKSRRTELVRRRRLRLIESSDYKNLESHRVSESSYGTELIERVRREDGSPWHTLESFEQVKFSTLPVPRGRLSKTIVFFSSLMNMSNITSLHLNLTCTTSDVTQVIGLIDHLSVHLVELKLEIYFDLDRDNEDRDAAIREIALNETSVIDCLNRLESLRHLNLVLSNLSSFPPLLPILSRLTTLAIGAGCFYGFRSLDWWIFYSIKQYAQNIDQNHVTSVIIYNMVDLRDIPQFDTQLASKFTDLSVSYGTVEDFHENDEDKDDLQDMRLFCARFSNLTKLQINHCNFNLFASLPMTKLAQCLSSLTQLVQLDLKFFDIPPVEEVQPEEGEEDAENDNQVEQAQQQITQVPSVALLTIRLYLTKSHSESERLFISDIFPNLQVLRLEHQFADCPDCEISPVDGFDRYIRDSDPERARRIAECKRLTRQPFRRCANLHTVALVDSRKETLINLDDL